MTLLDLNHFSAIFEPLAGKRIGLVDGKGNVGDLLIFAATKQLLDALNMNWKMQDTDDECKDTDVLLLFGGGNMGNPNYGASMMIREEALALGPPVWVLPQSFHGPENKPYDRVFVRERVSLKYCPNGILAPDMALGYTITNIYSPPTEDMGVFLRTTTEALFDKKEFESLSLGDPTLMCSTLDEYLHLASRYKHIVTDRLHFAIASLIHGNMTTLLPNAYHKNRGMWETWLKDLGCNWMDTPLDAVKPKSMQYKKTITA